jgi:hypothetical protein
LGHNQCEEENSLPACGYRVFIRMQILYLGSMKYFIKTIGLLVWALGVYMINFGVDKDMPPPIMTGIGFVLIGLVFLLQKQQKPE